MEVTKSVPNLLVQLSADRSFHSLWAFPGCGTDSSWRRRHKFHTLSGAQIRQMVQPKMWGEQILLLISQNHYRNRRHEEHWHVYAPVAVKRMVIFTDSPSITCAPELDPMGDRRLVMACIPCRVPARTRYSFEVSWASPSEFEDIRIRLKMNYMSRTWTCEIALINQSSGFIYDLWQMGCPLE